MLKLLSLLCACFFLLSACATSTKTTKSLSVKSVEKWVDFEKGSFALKYPNDWQLDLSGQENTTLFLFAPPYTNNNFRANINLIIIPNIDQLTLEDFVQETHNIFVSLNARDLKQSALKNSKNQNYYQLKCKHLLIPTNELEMVQNAYIYEDNIYILTYTQLPDNLLYENIAQEILASFILN